MTPAIETSTALTSDPRVNGHSSIANGQGAELPDSESLYEIVDGKRVEKIMSVYAVKLTGMVHYFLQLYAFESKAGVSFVEMLFALPGLNRKRRPDVAFVTAGSWALDRPVPRIDGWAIAPDLAVEIVSPTNNDSEILTKVVEYFEAGVKQVWVIWPRHRKIHVYLGEDEIRSLKPGNELLGGDVLPGFRLSVSELFQAAGAEEPAS
jgi:Uma2 family endonuclease